MFSKKWLINMLLAGAAVWVAINAYDAWSQRAVIPEDAGTAAAIPPPAQQIDVAGRDSVSAAAYDLVVEKNLFSAERKEIIPSAPEVKAEKPPDPKAEEKPVLSRAEQRAVSRLALVGVVLTEDRKTALIQGVGGKRRGAVQWVVEGDEVEGMRVSQIRDEKVLLTSGDADVEILLYDPQKPRKRSAPRKEGQPTVLSTGGGAAAEPAKNAEKTKSAAAPAKKIVRSPARSAGAATPLLRKPPREKNPT